MLIRGRLSAKGLIAKLYRFWHPHVDRKEFDFYRTEIEQAKGGALELACGSGRLLLPYLKEGLNVEGVEASPEMITLLRRKAQKGGVEPGELYCQKPHELSLKKTYDLIYCPLGSFQLISDRTHAQTTLEKCFRYLNPGKKLVIALFLPWNEVSSSVGGWSTVSDRRLSAKDMRQILREEVKHDPVEQVIFVRLREETWLKREILEVQERCFSVRWYSKGEFFSMLKEAGFSEIQVERKYSSNDVNQEGFMLFIASK